MDHVESGKVKEPSQKTEEAPKTLLECNLWLLNNQELCDVHFNIGGEKIGSHKLFLMSRSKVFQVMFANRWEKDKESEVELVDCDPHYFKLFLKFIYADQFVSSMRDAVHLLTLADKYDISLLKEKCQTLIQRDIGLEDSVAVYQTARMYNLPELQNSACKVMCENFDKLMKHESFFQADVETLTTILQEEALGVMELEIFQGIIRWNTEVKSNSGLDKLIPLIRFPVMTPEEFTRHVVPTKVLTNDQVIEVYSFFHADSTVSLQSGNKLLNSKFSTVPRSLSTVVELFPGPQLPGQYNVQYKRASDFLDTLRFCCHLSDQRFYSVRTIILRGPNPQPHNGYILQPNIPTTEEKWRVSVTIRYGSSWHLLTTGAVVFQKSDILISNMKDTCILLQPPVPLKDFMWYLISVKYHSDVSVWSNVVEGFNLNSFRQLPKTINIADVGSFKGCQQYGSPAGDACTTRGLGISIN